MIEEDGEAEAQCHFCNEKYRFDKKQLEEIERTSNLNEIKDLKGVIL